MKQSVYRINSKIKSCESPEVTFAGEEEWPSKTTHCCHVNWTDNWKPHVEWTRNSKIRNSIVNTYMLDSVRSLWKVQTEGSFMSRNLCLSAETEMMAFWVAQNQTKNGVCSKEFECKYASTLLWTLFPCTFSSSSESSFGGRRLVLWCE